MQNFLQKHFNYFIELFITLAILALVFKALDLFDAKMKSIIADKSSDTRLLRFSSLFTKVLKVLLVVIVVADILQNHGYSISSLLTGVGITGLIVGFAAKEAISNVLGSVAILSDNVYNIGDYIIMGQEEGTVEEINLRSTKLRTLENSLIIIPNNLVANAVIKNISAIDKRRLDETFGLIYETSDEKIDEAINILNDILKNNDEIEEGFSVFLEKFDSSSINIRIFALVKYPDLASFRLVRENVLKEILKKFRASEIEFAFSSTTVYLKNEN